MTQLVVDRLHPELEPAYETLVASDEAAMVYGTLPFRRFLADAAGGDPEYLVATRGDSVVGALPVFRRSDPALGTVVNSLPWYGSHGGCIIAPGEGRDVRAALLRTLAGSLPSDLVAATVVLTPTETAVAETYDSELSGTTRDTRIGQMTPLPEGGSDLEERLARTLRQKTRNLVRKALAQGFERVCSNELWAWEYLVDLHTRNLEAIGGKAKPRAHFEALRRELPPEWLRLSVARLGGRPVAALLLVRYARTVEYFTPAVEHDARSSQPLSFLIWHELVDAVGDGYRVWNWGGTWESQRSLHHFKQGWGAVDHRYDYVIRTSPESLTLLRADPPTFAAAFPFYYLYPFDRLAP
jgi:Acetyltransferase (GNAT) domain